MTPTAFQSRVYAAARTIPCGRVTTYGSLAAAIGCCCPRAVGQALRCNPYAPEVPCHRVIGADLRIGGFGGCREGQQIERKLRLLAAEGVAFVAGRLADPARLFNFAHRPSLGDKAADSVNTQPTTPSGKEPVYDSGDDSG